MVPFSHPQAQEIIPWKESKTVLKETLSTQFLSILVPHLPRDVLDYYINVTVSVINRFVYRYQIIPPNHIQILST